MKGKHQHLMEIFAELRPLYANRFLSATEISKIRTLCEEFRKYYPLSPW